MAFPSSVMGNQRFSYFIFIAFMAGTLLLVWVQFNSAKNTANLIENNTTLLRELRSSNHLREIDRDILGVESRIRASIATNDTSHLEGVDNKINQVSSFLDSLSVKNKDTAVERLINRLSVLALEKKKTKEKLLMRYFTLGNMDDKSSIANPGAREISNEITSTTAKIYESRQHLMLQLSRQSEQMGRKARLYDIAILNLLLISGGAVCLFIVRQFRRQNQLIADLNISEQKALDAARTKENFLANMSHEIRTPLGGILGFTNLLKKRPLDNTSSAFVDSIQQSGENLMAIINDILDLSKIEAGMMRITPGVFSVHGLIDSVETLFAERVNKKGLTMTSQIEPAIPDTLKGDATRLTQILVNLIGNAIKFTEQGHIDVEVYNKKQLDNQIILGFKVADTGIGIDKKKLDEIFERFNQAEDSITRAYGGTGLGLSIAKNLILLQDGNIEVSSEKGKGTLFHFYIPYEVAAKQLKEKPRPDFKYFKNTSNAPLKILVVDDNLMNQSLMKHVLEQWHVSFDVVSNGLLAIRSLEEKSYDLVLMDIQMPEMDGYTATEKIREDLKLDIPVIAMTAHAMAGEREKCLSRGMSEYISKPINENELFTLISGFGLSGNKMAERQMQKTVNETYQFIDLDYMQAVSNGDQTFEVNMTKQFISNVPESIELITMAMEAGNTESIHSAAHDLKSSVAIMGLLPLLDEKLDQLEAATAFDKASVLCFNEVKDIIDPAIAEAKHFLTTLQP